MKNKKGQALVESLFMTLLTTGLVVFIIKTLVTLIATLALETLIENYFICSLTEAQNCNQQLKSKSQNLPLKNLALEFNNSKKATQIKAHFETYKYFIEINRDFNYEIFDKKF